MSKATSSKVLLALVWQTLCGNDCGSGNHTTVVAVHSKGKMLDFSFLIYNSAHEIVAINLPNSVFNLDWVRWKPIHAAIILSTTYIRSYEYPILELEMCSFSTVMASKLVNNKT